MTDADTTPPKTAPRARPSATNPPALRIAVYDDVVAVRQEVFHIPGTVVDVFGHADQVVEQCKAGRYDVVFMDFSMGPGRKDGAAAVTDLRAAGFAGKIIPISSDPAANAAIRMAGANESLSKKAHLRSYLVHLGATHMG